MGRVLNEGELLKRKVEVLCLDMKDGRNGTLEGFLDRGADFVHSCLSGEERRVPVLVHCSMGKSRSVSIVLAYLMKHRGLSLRQSLSLTRSKRQRAYPLLKFWRELDSYEQALTGSSGTLPMEQVVQLHAETQAAKRAGTLVGKLKKMNVMGFS